MAEGQTQGDVQSGQNHDPTIDAQDKGIRNPTTLRRASAKTVVTLRGSRNSYRNGKKSESSRCCQQQQTNKSSSSTIKEEASHTERQYVDGDACMHV